MGVTGSGRAAASCPRIFDGAIEKLKAEFRREQARRGGSARKTDTLQELVEQIASRMPGTTSRQLQDRLQDRQGDGVVEYIEDSVISFRTQGGRIKTAPISGLKDRLSRAKKKLPSR